MGQAYFEHSLVILICSHGSEPPLLAFWLIERQSLKVPNKVAGPGQCSINAYKRFLSAILLRVGTLYHTSFSCAGSWAQGTVKERAAMFQWRRWPSIQRASLENECSTPRELGQNHWRLGCSRKTVNRVRFELGFGTWAEFSKLVKSKLEGHNGKGT